MYERYIFFFVIIAIAKGGIFMDRFPKYRYDYIFNSYNGEKIKECKLLKDGLILKYPCRLDAMAINPAAVCYNDSMVFTPGEVVISTKKYIIVTIKKVDNDQELIISKTTKRKVLVKHAFSLMKSVLKFNDSFYIDVNDDGIPKHCGFGSSSSTIAAVASSINELYGCPISNNDLIKYLASNHGEEISDDDDNNLKMVQCIGGGATNGLVKSGIIVIAGKSTVIAKMNYIGKIVIGVPKDFEVKDANYLMEKEEENLYKFKKTGELYSEKIAYELLHRALPGIANGSIKELADVVFDYRFNMGSIENCSFVYPKMIDIAKKVRGLYENNKCEFLSLSSVGPAYFAIVKNEEQLKECEKKFNELGMNVMISEVNNETYIVDDIETNIFWNKEKTRDQFQNKNVSKYITDEIDKLDSNAKVIDIGCGGGRYSRYVKEKNMFVVALDKYSNMATSLTDENIPFIQGCFDNLPIQDNMFDVILSIGVIHNAITLEEFEKAISEMYRILKKEGKVIFSVFTNDVITDDLTYIGHSRYEINSRQPMILLSKDEINNLFNKYGFKIIENVDEHITDVGSGRRNVYTILLKK